MPLRLSIFLLSASALAHQILLMRLFSIVQWHHFAYMVISMALLGYGASGTFLSLFGPRSIARLRPFLWSQAVLFGGLSVGTFVVAQRVPFNPLEIAWDPAQLSYLALLYLLLAAPFFCAANFIGACLTRLPEEAHGLYAADLVGAGCGAALVIGALFVLPPATCLLLIGFGGFAAAALAGLDPRFEARRWKVVALLALGVAASFAWPGTWIEPRLSEFKPLRKALLLPRAEVIAERSSPLGLLTAVRSPAVPFRFAPGLSLAHLDPLPEQLAVFTDGSSMTVVDHSRGPADKPAYLTDLPSAVPYHLLERPAVLVLGAGGGTEVASALLHRARKIDAVEYNPQMRELISEELAPFAGDLHQRPEVAFHTDEARSFIVGARGSWDLIQISLLDASAGGMHTLSESYLYTVEAFSSYLDHLAPGGYLSITRWLRLPPRDSLRLVATAAEALARRGETATDRIAVLRSWNTVTVLIKGEPLTGPEIDSIREFAADRSFDTAWFPGIVEADANRFNQFDHPYHFSALSSILGSDATDFLRRYKFHVAPTTDNRPYFHHFLKWRTLLELLEVRRQGGAALLDWGYLVLIASLVQATVIGLVLILLPLSRLLRRRARGPTSIFSVGAYFFLLGIAFLFLEIAFIQKISLFLGHPLYAVAVVLAAFLVFAGLGSAASIRLPSISRAAAGIGLLAIAYLAILPPLFDRWIGLPDPLKVMISLAILAPLAFLMGMPFPLGLGLLRQREPSWIPWAWGVNGWSSVVSAILATLIAVHLGFRSVVLIAVLLYFLAARISWTAGRPG